MMLDALYNVLPPADALPQGRFRGVLSMDVPNALWEGKVFSGKSVRNIVFGREFIGGHVMLSNGEVVITYPSLPGLVDYLKPAGRGWLGKAVHGDTKFYFVLTPWV